MLDGCHRHGEATGALCRHGGLMALGSTRRGSDTRPGAETVNRLDAAGSRQR